MPHSAEEGQAAGTRHQRVVVALLRILQDYVERHGIGEALVSPYEVEFSDDTAGQPDILTDRLTWRPAAGVPRLDVDLEDLFARADRGLSRD